jgi:hypothetical protein
VAEHYGVPEVPGGNNQTGKRSTYITMFDIEMAVCREAWARVTID